MKGNFGVIAHKRLKVGLTSAGGTWKNLSHDEIPDRRRRNDRPHQFDTARQHINVRLGLQQSRFDVGEEIGDIIETVMPTLADLRIKVDTDLRNIVVMADRARIRAVVSRARVLLPAILRDLDWELGGR